MGAPSTEQQRVIAMLTDGSVSEIAWDGKGRPWRVRRNGTWQDTGNVPEEQEVLDVVRGWWRNRYQDDFPGRVFTSTMIARGGGWRYTYAPRTASGWGSSLYCRKINLAMTLERGRAVPPQVVPFLEALLAARTSFVVAGRPSSGKTTLLGGLILALPPDERMGIVEQKHELLLPPSRQFVSWEVGPARGETLADLARQATQAGFNRLVIGEVLGEEAYYFIKAMSQMPVMTTIHASGGKEGGMQLVRYAAEKRHNAAPLLAEQLVANAPFVLYIERDPREGIMLSEICEISNCSSEGRLATVTWFAKDRSGVLRQQPHITATPALMQRCEMYEVRLPIDVGRR